MSVRFKLKEILLEKKMSQRELAFKTGLRPNTINQICSNEVTRIYLDTIETICKSLNIGIQELLEIYDEEKTE
jgi:putative transcriptional regulator